MAYDKRLFKEICKFDIINAIIQLSLKQVTTAHWHIWLQLKSVKMHISEYISGFICDNDV